MAEMSRKVSRDRHYITQNQLARRCRHITTMQNIYSKLNPFMLGWVDEVLLLELLRTCLYVLLQY